MAEGLEQSEEQNNLMIITPSQLPEVNVEGVSRRHSVGSMLQQERSVIDAIQRPGSSKRGRDDDEEEDKWVKVGRFGKRNRSHRGSSVEENIEVKIEAYITSANELPKQFAFARFLKENNISEILHIKYMNPYKIWIHFGNERSLDKLSTCQTAVDNGWKVYKTLEVSSSYGVIRKVELDLNDEEVKKSITSDVELLVAKRLARRSDDGSGWTPSECVRLCFRGSSLPPYIYVYGIRVKVDPYTFPVTQCSLCWTFGHPRKMCPRKKVVCPKCSKHHENCETTTFVCVNCNGNHIALSKKCPAYLKERKLRTIMADFNCTYRRALTMYVAEMSPSKNEASPDLGRSRSHSNARTFYPRLGHSMEDIEFRLDIPEPQPSTSYASAVINASSPNNKRKLSKDTEQEKKLTERPKKSKENKKKVHKQQISEGFMHEWECICSDSDCAASSDKMPNNEKCQERIGRRRTDKQENTSFDKIFTTLKNIFFNYQDTIENKIIAAVKLGTEWLVSFLAKHFRDLPFIKSFLS